MEKKIEKQKNDNEDFREFTGLLLSLFREIFRPEPSKVQLPPPRPVRVYVVQVQKKKGVIRRFLNWLW